MITDLTRTFAVDDAALARDRWGDPHQGKPLFLCHGFSGSSHDFALVDWTAAVEQHLARVNG